MSKYDLRTFNIYLVQNIIKLKIKTGKIIVTNLNNKRTKSYKILICTYIHIIGLFKVAYWIRSNIAIFSIAPHLVIALPTLR